MNTPRRPVAVNLDALGDELRAENRVRGTAGPEVYAPPRVRLPEPVNPTPAPTYDRPPNPTHDPDRRLPAPGAPDLGKMTAEAVLKQHEVAAQAVVDMGKEVIARITALEAALRECHRDMELIANAANTIREKGERVAQQVAEAGQLSVDIRAVCEEFVKKVGG